ncbi:MAG: di-trans,poly-cis-decaprenylcistransferase, partial [Gemmatimonadetes bacterium]
LAAVRHAEGLTAEGRAMTLRVAVDYSARWAIARAAAKVAVAAAQEGLPEALPSSSAVQARFRRALADVLHDPDPVRDADLIVRTGGERRLSDFLLWEAAYAELVFSPLAWPDFTGEAFEDALREYHRRERRFGRVAGEQAPAARAG